LARACRETRRASEPRGAIRGILKRALEATGAERAFLVTSTESGRGSRATRVEVSLSLRPDGRGEPSRTVIDRALRETRPLICIDVPADHRFVEGVSVRGLGLRLALAAPVPVDSPERAALVVDGRSCGDLSPAELEELVEAFAALVGLAVGRVAPGASSRKSPNGSSDDLVGSSREFGELMKQVCVVAPWELPVLVTGESGTGKECIVRRLHAESPRRGGPFVALNCAAVPETLIEAELFGAARGAYTGLDRNRPGLFRLASGGTLFMDEVGDMPRAMQAKLLRVLQDGRVRSLGGETEESLDVRVVAATHQDLASLVREGRFREDLYYRLAMVELRVPALRDRPDDISPLVRHLASRLAGRTGFPEPRCSPEALEALRERRWPGNVRELESVLARALVRSGGEPILPCHLDPEAEPAGLFADGDDGSLERKMVEAALRQSHGVVKAAAERIGWSRQKLRRRMVALRISRTGNRD